MSVRHTPGAGTYFYRFQYNHEDYCLGGFRTKDAAQTAEHFLLDELIRAKTTPLKEWQEWTFARAAAWILANRSIKKARKGEIDRIILPEVSQYFGVRKLNEITSIQIQAFFDDYERRNGILSGHSFNRYLTPIRALYNFAIKNDLYEGKNPALRVETRKVPRRHVRFLYHPEEEAITPLAQAHADLWPYYLVGIETGMRIGEMRALRVKSLDLTIGQIFIEKSKSGESRYVPTPQPVLEFLRDQSVGKDPEALLLPRRSDSHLRRKFRKIAKEAKVEIRRGLGVHMWRHTFANNQLSQGVELYTVSQILGHASYRMTEKTYGHLAQHQLNQATRNVRPFLGCNRIAIDSKKEGIEEQANASIK